MSIILLLLKIIGIILLVILGILILLIFLVLFVPAHYSFNGAIGERNGIQGKIHWLFHILTITFGYEGGEFEYDLRIFGIRKRIQKDNVETDEEDWEEDIRSSDEMLKRALPQEDQVRRLEKQEVPQEGQSDRLKKQDLLQEDRTDPSEEQGAMRQDNNAAKKMLPDRKKNERGQGESLYQKIRRRCRKFWLGIKRTLKKFLYTLTHIREKFSDIKNIITDETNKNSVLKTLAELKYLLKHFRFRKVYADLAFSTGDPALTGQALGVLCMIPAMYRYQVHVYPDFDSENIYVKGNFSLKGHMRMTHVLISFMRLFTNKEFRTFIKGLMK